MKKLFICMCVLFLITGCSQTVKEIDMPETETAAKEEMSPPVIPAETEEAPEAAEPPEEDVPVPGKVVVPAPSFTPVHITVSDFGDMAPDPEGYFYFVKDDMNEIEYGCGITMDFPDSWQLEYTAASDIPRSEAGIYSTKRMEYYSFLYRTAETDVTTVECTTPAGQMYRYWETPGSTMEGLGVIWHHCEYAVDVNNERFWFHIYFLTFSDDPAGYFEDYIQPMIDSVTISVDQ